jgi:hypothetical protein
VAGRHCAGCRHGHTTLIMSVSEVSVNEVWHSRNGIVARTARTVEFGPDGEDLVHSSSRKRCLTAFTGSPRSGTRSNRPDHLLADGPAHGLGQAAGVQERPGPNSGSPAFLKVGS